MIKNRIVVSIACLLCVVISFGNTQSASNPNDLSCGWACHGGDESYPSANACTNNIDGPACAGASSCDGTDLVKNIHLNATVYYTTETIGVTMDVMCSGTGDEVKIWYYNGSTWTEEFYDATCNYAAAAGNYTDSIKIRGTGTHYIRGQVTYGTLSGDDQCFTGPYGDNDDLSFVVEVYSPPAGGCCTFSDGYCACAPACSPVDMDAFMEGCFT